MCVICIICDDGDGMTVNCGGNDGVIDDGNIMRSPSPTGPLHRALGNMFSGHVGPQNRFSDAVSPDAVRSKP